MNHCWPKSKFSTNSYGMNKNGNDNLEKAELLEVQDKAD